MESIQKLVWNTPLNHGVPEEPLPVFQELLDQVPTDLDKLLLETCAEKEECSLH